MDRIPNSTIKERTKVDDILEVIAEAKWKWDGYRGIHERQQVDSKMYSVARGRSRGRWHDDTQMARGNMV